MPIVVLTEKKMRQAITERNRSAVSTISLTVDRLRFFSIMASEYSGTPEDILQDIKLDIMNNAGGWGGRVVVFMSTMLAGRHGCLPEGGWNLEYVSIINKV
jgi:hypothetical protein